MGVSSLSRVFIVEPFNSGWIIEKLMRDIRDELVARGHDVRIGPPEDYQGEEIYFNSRIFMPRRSRRRASIRCL